MCDPCCAVDDDSVRDARLRAIRQELQRLAIRRQFLEADRLEVDAQTTRYQAQLAEMGEHAWYPGQPYLGFSK